VEVRPSDDGKRAIVEVRDTGSGIPPATLEKIFEPFFTTKDAEKGTGLGLPVVREIVTSYGGTIDVESEVGKGTTFRFDLPR
jgi:two-component system cell cycle sensor histidine kinase/response regulator CckA